MKTYKYLILLLIFVAVSCAKEFDNSILEEDPIDLVLEKVEADLLIVVRDKSKEGVLSTCKINNEEYQSTDMGLIVLKDILLSEKGQTITIKAPGYYDEIRYVLPKLDTEMYLEVEMTALENVTGFNAAEGGNITVQDINITVPPNSLIDSDGDPYSGEVTIYADKSISALYYSESRTACHNLSSEDGEPVSLISMGGVNILLQDDNGDALSLKSGQVVNLTFEAKTYEAGTPSIPEQLEVRFFDSELEDWRFMSIASKTNEVWEAEIGSLGRIMWAQKEESTIAEVKIKDKNGNGINSVMVLAFLDAENPISIGFTNSLGLVRLHVPVGKDFRITTVPFCVPDPVINKFYSSISASSEVITLEDMTLGEVDYNMISGQVLGCDGQPISSSLIQVEGRPFDFYVYTNDNGQFRFPILNCNDIAISGYNIDSQELGTKIVIEDASPDDILDHTTPIVCGGSSYFINYVVNNETLSYTYNTEYKSGPWASNQRNTLIAYSTQAINLSNRTYVLFYSDENPNVNGPKSYDITQLDFYYDINGTTANYVCEGDCDGTVNVTNITNDVIEGTIENTTLTGDLITGVFRFPI